MGVVIIFTDLNGLTWQAGLNQLAQLCCSVLWAWDQEGLPSQQWSTSLCFIILWKGEGLEFNSLAGTKTPPFTGAKMAHGRPSALFFQIPQRDSWSPDGVGNMVKRDPMRSLKKKCDKIPMAVFVGSNTDCLGCHQYRAEGNLKP